jgi:Ty3 transposon capsid-like protein/Zinc knuckle
MARTRAAADREGDGAGRGVGRGVGRGAGRGRGRGVGRGGGRRVVNDEPEQDQAQAQPQAQAPNPDMIAMITQVVTAVLAQRDAATATAGGQQGQNTGRVNDVAAGDAEGEQGGYYEDVDLGIRVGNVPRGPRTGVKRGCSYKTFKSCGAIDYDGKGGSVKFVQWLEKMEDVIEISECSPDQRVKYVTNSFVSEALSWWKAKKNTRRGVGGQLMSWYTFKDLAMKQFCSEVDLNKMEREFLDHKMVGADHAAYTTRFYELSRLVPHLVTPESRGVEKYLRGLVPQIRTTMAAIRPATIEDAVLRSEGVTDELVQCGVLTVGSGNKRKEVGESSTGGKKVWRPDAKRQNRGRVFAATDAGTRKGYAGPHPLCTRCNLHHPANVRCTQCFNCQKVGHMAKDCKETAVRAVPVNAVAPNQGRPLGNRKACFECGSPDHFRNTCPQWVGQQVQVAVHPNQLQIAGPNQN